MSTLAVASGGLRSTLNPNAPLFIPATYQQVEDFSPEWWELVNTTAWFRDLWFRQHQEQETFDGEGDEEEDVANLLPDSFDLGIADDLCILDEAAFHEAYDVVEPEPEPEPEPVFTDELKENFKTGLVGSDMEAMMRSLNLKSSPRNGGVKPVLEPAKYKPLQSVGPKCSPRRIIQQPR